MATTTAANTTANTAATIRELINKANPSAEHPLVGGDDDNLLDVLDSLQVLRLVMDLEKHYGFKIDNADMTPENLGTVGALASFIDGKR